MTLNLNTRRAGFVVALGAALVHGALGGCGSKGAAATDDTMAATSTSDEPFSNPGVAGDGEVMVDPQHMDEITQLLQRRSGAVSRCLSAAVESGEVPRKVTRGRLTLEFKITSAGKAIDVAVVKTSIDARGVWACATKQIEEITFPALAKTIDWSFSYGLETM